MMSNRSSKDRKRKMDALISGDNSKAHGSGNDSQSRPPCAKNICMSVGGTAAGDEQQGNNLCHKFVTLLRDLEDEDASPIVHDHVCELQDVWVHKYPLPLSKLAAKTIKTGNKNYDSIIPELSTIGYRPLHLLSKGHSGAILVAQDVRPCVDPRDSECTPVAIKMFTGKTKRAGGSTSTSSAEKDKPGTAGTDTLDEILIHQRLQHQNIVTFLDAISFKGRACLVMEFCEIGNLQTLLSTHDARFLHEAIARRYLHQLHSAMEYIHLSGIAHRDVCLQNILVTNDNSLKMADFSSAVCYRPGDYLCTDVAGSLGYQAPEVLMKSPYDPRQADLWSLGCVLYSLVVGKLPYGRLKTEEEARALKPLSFPQSSVMVLSPSVKELLIGMLAYVPNARYTINRVRNSEWYTEANERVQIGNFYLVRQPRKVTDGVKEREMKAEYDI